MCNPRLGRGIAGVAYHSSLPAPYRFLPIRLATGLNAQPVAPGRARGLEGLILVGHFD